MRGCVLWATAFCGFGLLFLRSLRGFCVLGLGHDGRIARAGSCIVIGRFSSNYCTTKGQAQNDTCTDYRKFHRINSTRKEGEFRNMQNSDKDRARINAQHALQLASCLSSS
ncbi:hypothetical protein KPSA1_03805 [Pseudomonas syringae pv. actinidiae]|uniref:Uncharacterized protein n=1 Tax=Pseudomonas syringae pv. actinidiae TaxID=103796 RepID=A0A2V0QBL6_PSESF|nr:hypothetical protein KPSA1_03805 [Pseudomonas syringae pv. actinidiae]GBH17105.1 hypothetical protein KPSA3_03066 [Pseudomonas syringae pv. actinidiae]